jgi:hypothetical protein
MKRITEDSFPDDDVVIALAFFVLLLRFGCLWNSLQPIGITKFYDCQSRGIKQERKVATINQSKEQT